MLALACNEAAIGHSFGYFAPQYKLISEFYERTAEILHPIKGRASKNEGVYRTTTGGRIDFWSLENDQAGRSRKYHGVAIDEAAFAKNSTMAAIWDRAIKPTLLDYSGWAIAASTPNGIDEENWFYLINQDPAHGFTVYHAPTSTNPYLPAEEIENLKTSNHPLVYRQEYLAEFVDWSSAAFFSLESLLVENQPLESYHYPDYVFAVVDSALKSGREHDGTAVVYFAVNKMFGDVKLAVLDWDIVQIDGALLETWLPSVISTLDAYNRELQPRMGNAGVWIEDKASGIILLQQGLSRGWPVRAIDSKLTALGKDERAINCSGQVYRGEVKLMRTAYQRTKDYKGILRNQLLSQLLTFRPGDKDNKRADDLLDCFTYGVALALGNNSGY